MVLLSGIPGDAKKKIGGEIEMGTRFILRHMSPGCEHETADAPEYIWSAACRSVYEAGSGWALNSFVYVTKLHLVDVFYVHTKRNLLLPETVDSPSSAILLYNPRPQYLKLIKKSFDKFSCPYKSSRY